MRPGVPAPRAGSPTGSHEGAELFAELARVVAAAASQDRLRSFSLPYPRDAQLALDRMVLYCLGRGHTPPRSVPELLSWCRRTTAGDPLFQVPPDQVSPDATLIHPDGAMPTRTCLELASTGPRGEIEQEALSLMAGLAARCGSPVEYRRCRSFLMSRPLISQADRMHGRGRWNKAVWDRVKGLYGPVPEYLRCGRLLVLCGTCGLPARKGDERAGRPGTWCEKEDCPPGVPLRLVRDPGHSLLLRRSLRIFLVLAGPTERAALAELTRAKVVHEFSPAGLGSYRIRGAGAPDRLMRVYDRQQPVLLASRINESTAGPSAVTLVVVPRKQAGDPAYRTAFAKAVETGPHGRPVLTTPEDLVHDVRARTIAAKETEADHA
ncbi:MULTISPECIES: pPIWI_RE_Y domain-containing protein [unclassified Streptomyces]|uniref:pPIWI_RE_Y domain-containing protein n=1 Tax=Streptomyces sp. NPDC127532 TaxID=3345399 RepID=UPI0036303C3D